MVGVTLLGYHREHVTCCLREWTLGVSPAQWSKPYSILAPTQDSNPGGPIQNHKQWPLHYHCTGGWRASVANLEGGIWPPPLTKKSAMVIGKIDKHGISLCGQTLWNSKYTIGVASTHLWMHSRSYPHCLFTFFTHVVMSCSHSYILGLGACPLWPRSCGEWDKYK